MVGGGGRWSRPPVLSPRGTGDRQPSDPSRSAPPIVPPTRDASDAEIQSPRTSREIPAEEKNRSSGRRSLQRKRKRKPQTHRPARSTKAESTTARSTSAQPEERQPPAGKAESDKRANKKRPDKPPTREQEREPTATQKPGVRIFGGQQTLLCRSWGRRPCEGNHSHYTPRSPARESLPVKMDSGLEGNHSLKPCLLRSRSRDK